MGQLVKGQWKTDWYDTKSTGGKFVRPSKERFRHNIGDEGFSPEAGRYHLYVSLACPWAHRTLLFREFKELSSVITVSVVNPLMLDNGWTFEPGPGSTQDELYGKKYLYEIYQMADPQYSGRVTVPVLWDKKKQTIVNNESADVIRILNFGFNELTGNRLDFYPQDLREEIDEINELVYEGINNGVYKTGFATTQDAYEESYTELFTALEKIETRLVGRHFLCGDYLTEADWRLFTTLLRFDPVYFGHFKCNKKQIQSFTELSDYLRCLYQAAGVSATCDFRHIKTHYYASHRMINPTQIVPLGPELSLGEKTRRPPVDFAKHVRTSPEDKIAR